MKDYKNLFAEIDSLYDEFVSFWQDFCNIESPSEYKLGIDEANEFIIRYAKKSGWDIEVFKQEVSGNPVCITMNSQIKNKPITLSGHTDTVHSLGSFGNPAVTIKDDMIFGPGVTDCKGGIVAAIMAMSALQKAGFKNRPIQLILQTDEETNSTLSNKETINYICQKAKNSIAFLNCESTRGNSAVLWRKGIRRYEFNIKGASAHASRCAEKGASAITEAAYKIIELEKMKDVGKTTCNCAVISGGSSPNTVPDNCKFIAEVRFNSNEDLKIAENKVYEIANKSYIKGTECSVLVVSTRPAMEKSDKNFVLLDTMNEIYQKCNLPVLVARQSLGGSDAAEVTCSGIPCVDSIGVDGDFIHSKEEFARVSSLTEAAKRIAAVCYYI